MRKHQFTIEGMHCESCKMLVEEELEDAGAQNVSVSVDPAKQRGTASFESDLDREELVSLIEDLGEYTIR